MPPQIAKAGSGPAVQQAPPPQDQKDGSQDVSKSSSSTSTTKTDATSVGASKAGPAEPAQVLYNQKAAAETAKAFKKSATENKGNQNVTGQVMKSSLDNQLAASGPAARQGAMDVIKAGMTTTNDVAAFYNSGKINADDIKTIVKQQSGDKIKLDAAGVANLKGNENFKTAYFNATMELYKQQKPGSEMAQRYATASAEVIGSQPKENQLKFVADLKKEGSLNTFFKDASSQYLHKLNDTVGGAPPRGVANLVNTVANATPGQPFGKEELKAVRKDMFDLGTDLYANPDTAKIWNSNTTLKDGLSKIVREDLNEIWKQEKSENKASANPQFQKRMEGFFKYAMFSQPSGADRQKTSEAIADHMKNWKSDINDPWLHDSDFKKKYGADRSQMSSVMGETFGFAKNGMDSALKDAESRAAKDASRKSAISFVLDVGLSFVPGGKAFGDALGEQGAKVLGQFAEGLTDAMVDRLKDMTKEAATDYLATKLPGMKLDNSMNELKDMMVDTLRADKDTRYGTDFRAAYADTVVDKR